MKKTIIILLILSTVSLVGCSQETLENTSNFNEKELFIDRENAESLEILLDEYDFFDSVIDMYYSMPNLAEYEFYTIDDVLYTDYYFLENATREEIQNSKSMFMDIFIVNKSRPIGISSPRELIEMNLNWRQVNYRVFIGDTKIVEHNMTFDVGVIESSYFEDTSAELPSRYILTEEMQEFKRRVKRKYWWNMKKVSFQRSFKGEVLFIRFETRDEVKDNAIDYIKQEIELNLANALAKTSEEIYVTNQDYLGIVIEFYKGDKIYHQETCYNGNEKYWFSEYWGNHDFVKTRELLQ
ncbi:hypothetical protein SAMN05446037_10871 [Anaerovirgula multivorans]|uniref:Uncharacterized protein n=1 Tax=Anaerovirgula multivorans TaxID=312168 RepID=A0A239LL66_9FIRM|nr:hypothetical protein [Anaerovirgula multivorans]SNT31050.1 hypothetical protein SAMN05446037_10871 [Anaerovirgula multivorans]